MSVSFRKQVGWLSVAALLFPALAHSAQPVELSYQQDLQDKELLNISVEVGGYDVTSFAEFSDKGAVVSLGSELPEGEYSASVMAFYADGEVQTLSEQYITISPAAETTWNYNSALNTSYRVDEEQAENFDGVDEYNANGGVAIGVGRTAENYDANFDVQATYDANANTNAGGNEWELATYQVGAKHKGDYGSVGLSLGNNQVAQDNMLFSYYQRRGINLHAESANQAVKATLFSLVSDITTAYDDDLLTPDNSSNRTVGSTIAVNPFPKHPDRLLLQVGFVDGEGTTAGSGFTVVDAGTVYGGSSWNTTLDSLWLRRSLWLHLEYAESDFDSDGIDLGEGEISDDALKAALNLNSNGDLPGLGLDYWDLSLQHQEVGSYFYSIANLGLAGDLDAQRFTFNGSKGGVGFTIQALNQHNNVDNDPTRATLSVDYRALDVNYTPFVDQTQGLWAWIGVPSIYAYLHETDSQQDSGDAALTGFDLDNLSREYSLGLNFGGNLWSWGVSHTLNDVDDRTSSVFQNMIEVFTPAPDSENSLTSLHLSWYPNERFSISPNLQWNRYQESSVDNEYKTFNAGVDTQIQVIPQKLSLSMNYFFTGYDNRFGDPLVARSEQDNNTGSLQLLWKASEARNNRPGVDVYLNGSYSRQEDQVSGDDFENWQINLGFSLYWAGNQE